MPSRPSSCQRQALVVHHLLLKVRLRVVAHRAHLGRLGTHMQVPAVQALPHLHALALKHLARLNALDKLVVALLVSLLHGTDATELLGDLGKALLLGGLGELVVHRGPLVVLACSGITQVVQGVGNGAVVQILKPQLGVLGLVACGLGKDIRDLNVAILLGLRCVVAILGMRLGLTGKSGLEVLLGLGILNP